MLTMGPKSDSHQQKPTHTHTVNKKHLKPEHTIINYTAKDINVWLHCTPTHNSHMHMTDGQFDHASIIVEVFGFSTIATNSVSM